MISNAAIDATGFEQIDFNDPAFLDAYNRNMGDEYWRLNNLYMIIDKDGYEIPFQMNTIQRLLYNRLWYCNVILKTRQPGITTFFCIFYLDRCLANPNTHAVFISYSKDEVKETFHNIIRFAYDQLPFFVKEAMPAVSDTTTGMRFANGSSIRVTQSGRGGTFQLVHISEYGKTCAKWPFKAREIKSGTLNAIHAGNFVAIESTAEGREGEFYNICQYSRKLQEAKKPLNKLDFKFFFFPWYDNPFNSLDIKQNQLVLYGYQREYFDKLDVKLPAHKKLTIGQKAWYVSKQNVQGDLMKREHPSDPDEAFQSAIEGVYYASEFSLARKDGRITKVPHRDGILVDTWWDLGVDDYTVIWFTQDVGREIHVINFYFNCGEGFDFYYDILDGLKEKQRYRYGTHGAPHDVVQRDRLRAESYLDAARKKGLVFRIAPKLSILSGIQAVRRMLQICWFDEENCAEGIEMLESYRKKWNEATGAWHDKPYHDKNSNVADAFRTLATAHEFTSAYALEMHRAQTEHRNIDKKDPRGWT